MAINLNTNPYYDDFDPEKNYVKILFKPGYAVQARELTQLQTALQTQVTRLGNHFFKDGSIVLGNTGINKGIKYFDVQTIGNNQNTASQLLGQTVVGSVSNSKARVVALKSVAQNLTRIYFVYTSSTEFTSSDAIESTDSTLSFTLASPFTFGDAVGFTLTDSVFFIRGYFVFVQAQTVIVTEDDVSYNKRIGFVVDEKIISENDDETLLDNSQGSNNFSAPGADRYQIDFEIISIDYDPLDIEASAPAGFLEINRFVNGEPYKPIVARTEYSEIDNMLARRTYDESGDYTVKPFFIELYKSDLQTEFMMDVSPGKAYIRGYEFETNAPTTMSVERATETDILLSRAKELNFGSYVIVTTPTGAYLDYSLNPQINLRESSTPIGTANIRSIVRDGVNYRIYLYNINITLAGKTFANVTQLTTSLWSAALAAGSQGVLYTPTTRTSIVELDNSPIKSLVINGTNTAEYVAYKKYSTSVAGTSISVSQGTNEQFISSDSSDYIVINQSTGATIAVSAVSISTGTATLTISNTTANIDVFLPVKLTQVESKTKTKTTHTQTVSYTTNDITLEKSDCIKVNSVILSDGTNTFNATTYFTLDNGQRDDHYAFGILKRTTTLPTGYTDIEITFEYFEHSTATGFCSVDSYADYDGIPTYTSSSGVTYNLRDCIDFRPVQTSTGFISVNKPLYGELFETDYEFYLPRVDKLILSKDRKFSVVKGISSVNPDIPLDLADSMTLYVINVPAYTKNPGDVGLTYVDNRRFTMRDIGKLKKKVERLEYYTTLSLLEKQAKEEEILDSNFVSRFKNGILVDSFAGHSVGDISRGDYSCSIEPETRTLRPKFASYQGDYVVNRTSNDVSYRTENVRATNDLVTLNYTTEKFAEQPLASRFVNVNPYMIANWNGVMTLYPVGDTWIDKMTKPDLVVNLNGENDAYTILADTVNNPASVGLRFNDWQTVSRGVIKEDNITSNTAVTKTSTQEVKTTTTINNQTTTTNEVLARTGLEISRSQESVLTFDAGERIVDNSIIPFIRPQVVKFSAKGMKPNTQLYVFFDGVNLTNMTSSAMRVVLTQNLSASHVGKIAKIRLATNNAFVFDVVASTNNLLYCFLADDTDQDLATISQNNVLEYQLIGETTWISNAGTVSTVDYDDELTTDDYGVVGGAFFIPNDDFVKFRTGEKTVRITDSEIDVLSTTAAETKFVAQGWSQSTERTLVSTRVATVSVAPILETNQTSTSTTTSIVVNTTTETTAIPQPVVTNVASSVDCGTYHKISGSARQTFNIKMTLSSGKSRMSGYNFSKFSKPFRFIVSNGGNASYTSPWYIGSAEDLTLSRQALKDRNLDNSNSVVKLIAGVSETTDTFGGTDITIRSKNTQIIVENPFEFEQPGANFAVTCPAAIPVTPPAPVVPPVPTAKVFFGGQRFVGDDGSQTSISYDWIIRINESQFTRSGNSFLTRSEIDRTLSVGIQFGSNAKPEITYNFTTNGVTTSDSSRYSVNRRVSLEIPAETQGTTSGVTLTPITVNATYVSGADGWTPPNKTITITPILQLVRNPPVVATTVVDPVAQTFFVSAQEYPVGIFIKSVDLFFRKKSNDIPIAVQLRPVVNGYPSSSTILPFGISILDGYYVNVSNDASAATRFEFENIIHLMPGEYSFVAIADTDEYELWTAAVGDFELTDQTKRINSQPYLGSMFKSQNSSTWTPVQEEDLKFTLNKCVFDTSVTGKVLFDNTFNADSNVEYDLFYTNGETVDFVETNIDYQVNTGTSWKNYQFGSNYKLDQRSDSTDLQFIATMSTANSDITPVIDIQRLKSTLVQNIVNNESANETDPIFGNALSRYITRKVELAPGFEGKDLKVSLFVNKEPGTDVEVYYKVATRADSNFDEIEYTKMDQESAQAVTGFAEYKYKTPYVVAGETAALASGEKFYLFIVKIVMKSANSVNVPLVRDLRVVVLDE